MSNIALPALLLPEYIFPALLFSANCYIIFALSTIIPFRKKFTVLVNYIMPHLNRKSKIEKAGHQYLSNKYRRNTKHKVPVSCLMPEEQKSQVYTYASTEYCKSKKRSFGYPPAPSSGFVFINSHSNETNCIDYK